MQLTFCTFSSCADISVSVAKGLFIIHDFVDCLMKLINSFDIMNYSQTFLTFSNHQKTLICFIRCLLSNSLQKYGQKTTRHYFTRSQDG